MKKTSSTKPTPQPNQHNTGGKAKPVFPDYDSLQRYDEHLRLRGKAGRTREEYLRYARKVAELARVDPATLGEDRIRGFFLYLKENRLALPRVCVGSKYRMRPCRTQIRTLFCYSQPPFHKE